MNLQESDILLSLKKKPFINQRVLAETSRHSIDVVNRSLKQLKTDGYLDNRAQLTPLAYELFEQSAPKNAIILAAGLGMRMAPINLIKPKALIEVNDERLIDRLISQLKAVGINDITVVVGFMKDSFEYLIDEYGVNLVFNSEYAVRNNLHSLALVANRIHNTYIAPCDIWCNSNPFHSDELYSWYMVSDLFKDESSVRVGRKMQLMTIPDDAPGNAMVGISYLTGKEAQIVRDRLTAMDDDKHAESFWEDTLYKKDRMIVWAKVVNNTDAVEINTYEQLKDLISGSNHLKPDEIKAIAHALKCREQDITDIHLLKKGMTNRSFLFSVNDKQYIIRIPGKGTEHLINRKHEADVFQAISGRGLCDDPVYINPENGYKITRYLKGARVCDPENYGDLKKCMDKLRTFHKMKLTVSHAFDLFDQINYYENLWEGAPSIYRDYQNTKTNVFSLRTFIDRAPKDRCLTHIDAVSDNFLFHVLQDGTENLQLTDWEYAGMQDPHVDIAMFCIYSLFNKQQCDKLIDIYFNGECDDITRAKIYAYIATSGLLWSNWCEYKRKLGVEFGEYSLRQYRYAKEYFLIANEMFERLFDKGESAE